MEANGKMQRRIKRVLMLGLGVSGVALNESSHSIYFIRVVEDFSFLFFFFFFFLALNLSHLVNV